MAIPITSRFPCIRIPPVYFSHLSSGVKFKHILMTASVQVQVQAKPATSPIRGHIKPATFTANSVRWRSALRNCVGALHTGTMAAVKVDLNSTAGDWKEIKDFLLSQPAEVRRQYYRTDAVRLDDIPAWSHAGVSAGPEGSHYPRNEKLDGKISIYSGNITVLEVDAIVNAANQTLLGGGGDVIHTVGPIAQGGVGEAEKNALRACYSNSLRNATENNLRSVQAQGETTQIIDRVFFVPQAFPCISTGIYGYPPEEAVHEALATVREHLDEHHDKLDRIIFCVFLAKDKGLYLQNLPLYFPVGVDLP
uniref:ADP-ribose glycohydrolase MACROD1 isoform X4 n=1 Tax=Doryrhamphus excisus TaxID=161450 RepID=UPI0025AE725C|nr:ADP-ribose glycohydrolase MACROD1 isoform X4 [Doryrhamphus excisus]